MYNYGGYSQQPIVFVPSPANSAPGTFGIESITRQISELEALKKILKEAPKDDKKKPEGPNVISMMLLMILLSPITGPIMSKFFSTGLSYLPH